ncbi:MAG: GntG family PLP-dependent aldolase [Bacteroidales bacterium]|jgi:threonine aldolase|nr:GntG family PLP-dependent aldolase [Bacteroidales bacterium]
MIDLRSDTVTKPSPGMLEFMMKASVGDMIFGEDPMVNELEEMSASMFGVEAALYCPSGTMTNQIAIKVHTRPGDEVICSRLAHIYQFEAGGVAFNSGASVALIDSENGTFTAADVEQYINNPNDWHKAYTRLVEVENTVNRGAGACWDFEELLKIRELCDRHSLGYHLDGARLFNAMTADGRKPEEYGALFDSISICLSKGLGAPVGSVLLGNRDFIRQGQRIRKVLGGAMRQAGYIAAAGIYALRNNLKRLSEDHRRAVDIAKALEQCSLVENVSYGGTNLIIFTLLPGMKATEFLDILKEYGILALKTGERSIRFVTHLDLIEADIRKTCEVLTSL